MFPARQGGAWDEHNFERCWRRVRDAAVLRGVRPLPWHCTRHTFISWGLAAGIPSKRIAEWVGASVATIERHYAHVMPLEDDSMSFLDGVPANASSEQVR